MRREIPIVVGLVRGAARKILISKRKVGALEGGLWEFPGGKIEDGEPPLQLSLIHISEPTRPY